MPFEDDTCKLVTFLHSSKAQVRSGLDGLLVFLKHRDGQALERPFLTKPSKEVRQEVRKCVWGSRTRCRANV